jgi:hypothetical protein
VLVAADVAALVVAELVVAAILELAGGYPALLAL